MQSAQAFTHLLLVVAALAAPSVAQASDWEVDREPIRDWEDFFLLHHLRFDGGLGIDLAPAEGRARVRFDCDVVFGIGLFDISSTGSRGLAWMRPIVEVGYSYMGDGGHSGMLGAGYSFYFENRMTASLWCWLTLGTLDGFARGVRSGVRVGIGFDILVLGVYYDFRRTDVLDVHSLRILLGLDVIRFFVAVASI
jgi:hypothetical protein